MIHEDELRNELEKEIIGQDHAVETVVRAVMVADFGACDPSRPLSSFLFLGPTGVGKSQMGRSLAKILHGNEKEAVVVNCTEFRSPHDIAKLMGAPPGYIGHDHPPFLIQEKIDRKPTIVIFEELEKADRAFYDLLLQILERGELKTGRGEDLRFRNCFIFMTSNIGVREDDAHSRGHIGFLDDTHQPISPEEVKNLRMNTFIKAARGQFNPEFLNRLDEMIVFNKLEEQHLLQILEKMLLDVRARLAMGQLGTTLSDNAKKFLVKKGTDLFYGARPLRRAIRKYLEFPVVSKYRRRKEALTNGPLDVYVDLDKNGEELIFNFRKQLLSGKAAS